MDNKVTQFGSCTFMPITGKALDEVYELVLCTKNRWDSWTKSCFYVNLGEGGADLP